MANSTARVAKNIHGTNPQFLIERVIRGRIYDSAYWKEHCFALTAESLVDKAVSINYLGGTYGIQRPTNFLCLVCKLLQIQPDREIILEYLQYPDLKYLRAIAALYARLTFPSLQVYETLEPMLEDYRKLRFREMSGTYHITYMDEFINDLLTKDRVCELILPRMTRRDVLEEMEGLAPRMSKLEDALLAASTTTAKVKEERYAGQAGSEDADDAAASDDSAAHLRQQKTLRIQRAQKIRQEKENQKVERQRAARDYALQDRTEDGDILFVNDGDIVEEDYPSQEEENEDSEGEDEKRFISPSRSIDGSEQGYQSRSPSRSPDRAGSGYISRSVSRSPDRD